MPVQVRKPTSLAKLILRNVRAVVCFPIAYHLCRFHLGEPSELSPLSLLFCSAQSSLPGSEASIVKHGLTNIFLFIIYAHHTYSDLQQHPEVLKLWMFN